MGFLFGFFFLLCSYGAISSRLGSGARKALGHHSSLLVSSENKIEQVLALRGGTPVFKIYSDTNQSRVWFRIFLL